MGWWSTRERGFLGSNDGLIAVRVIAGATMGRKWLERGRPSVGNMIHVWGQNLVPNSGARQNFASSYVPSPSGHTCCDNKYIWPLKFTPTHSDNGPDPKRPKYIRPDDQLHSIRLLSLRNCTFHRSFVPLLHKSLVRCLLCTFCCSNLLQLPPVGHLI
jgi:hypothetical protein